MGTLTRQHWAWLIGALIGFLLTRSLLGALLGAYVGHTYTKRTAYRNDEPDHRAGSFATRSQQSAFTIAVIVLGAKMARSDGTVSRTEIDAFKRVFKIPPAQEEAVGFLFNRALSSASGFEPYALSLARTFRDRPLILESILGSLFIIGAADGALSPSEIDFLKRVCLIFGFTPEAFARIAAQSGVSLPSSEPPKDKLAEAYTVLGVSQTATADEIKKAYRSLIREHHPDKLMAQGAPKEYLDTATETMKRINVAYSEICKAKGIK